MLVEENSRKRDREPEQQKEEVKVVEKQEYKFRSDVK